MRLVFVALGALSLAACKPESPAGTSIFDWTYAVNTPDAHPPVSKSPPKVVTSTGEWPVSGAPPVKLKFETEIGDLVDDVHWNWPLHIRVTLAEPTRAKLPTMFCMPAPPGNKVVGGVLVRPVGHDGVTPSGVVACFVNGTKESDSYVFDVDGDGQLTRSVPSH